MFFVYSARSFVGAEVVQTATTYIFLVTQFFNWLLLLIILMFFQFGSLSWMIDMELSFRLSESLS